MWPPDSDVVATTSLSGGHHILSGGYQIKIFSAVVPAGLRTTHPNKEFQMLTTLLVKMNLRKSYFALLFCNLVTLWVWSR